MFSASQASADPQYDQSGAAVPDAGVARISATNGSVVIRHSDASASLAAVVNAPITAGDYLTTGANSHAEVQLDDTNFLRADAGTQLRFAQLDPDIHTVQLAVGTVELSVLRHPDSHPQIQTPSIVVRPYESGRFRVTVTQSGDTIVTVRSGRADLVGPQGTQTLGAGLSMIVNGPADAPRIQPIATVPYDDFDSWNVARDEAAASELAAASYAAGEAATNSYGDSGMVGFSQLNGYGQWYSAAAYGGSVWVPYGQIAGWSPYRYGRWAWQPNVGWTWVGYEPWGWAPYHYGRWFYQPGIGWAWFPGQPHQYFWWQPALVVFFGYGPGYGAYGPWGNLAWAPLGPYDPYVPYLQRWPLSGSAIAHAVPITTVKNIGNTYRNANAPGGVIAIHGSDLGGGGTYRYLQVHEGDLRDVAFAKGGLPIAPSTTNYRYAGAAAVAPSIAPLSPRFNTSFAARPPAAIDTSSSSSSAWSRFITQSSQAVPSQSGQSIVHPAGSTAPAASTPLRSGNTTDIWSRFAPLGVSAPSAGTAPRAGLNQFTFPMGSGAGNHYGIWSMPRIYAPMPNAGVAPAPNFAPVHAGNPMPNAGSNHPTKHS